MANMVNAAGVNSGRAAIFDLDGTLLDSMGVWDAVDVEFLGRRGFDVPADYMQKVSAMQFHDIAAYTIRRFGLADTPEELMREWNDLAYEAYTTTVELKPGARAYLEWLRASGARLAVATSMLPSLREPAMRHAGIYDLFDVVVGTGDDGSSGKDNPVIFLHTAQLLGVKPAHCTVFEDLLTAVESAKRAGMHVWGVQDDSSAMHWERICETADGVLFDFTQAPRQLT